jgi:aminoglycoside phosphotransferase (APT) family kinase protein
MNQLPTAPALPWHDAHPLDAHDVAAIVAADFPEFRDAAVTPLGDGWDFKVFLLDDTWAFRFPKRRQCVRILEREMALLDALAAKLPTSPVDFPHYRYRVREPLRFALPYGGYRHLPGTPLIDNRAEGTDPFAIGAQLGEFLRTLQRAAPLPRPRTYRDQIAADLLAIRAELDAVAAVLPAHITTASRALLTRVPPPDDDAVCFQHDDLGAEHILIECGGISAIIDWGDAGWGHPVADAVGLWAWGGDLAVNGALTTWQRTLTRGDWARLRLRGAAYAIGSAYYGYKAQRDALYATALGWLERMYQAGQLFDPAAPDG